MYQNDISLYDIMHLNTQFSFISAKLTLGYRCHFEI